MNLFEYEGKQIMRSFDIPIPEGRLVNSGDSATPMPYPFILKAQVMTGGRGKAGGVKVCNNEKEYTKYAHDILTMNIKGYPVCGLWAEQLMDVDRELYLSITLQGVAKPTLIASRMGGMDIEKVSEQSPDEIIKLEIDPFTGLKSYQIDYLAKRLDIEDRKDFKEFINKVQRVFFENDALLVEINPLGVCKGRLIAMDSKFVIDDHSVSMQDTIEALSLARHNLERYIEAPKEPTTITYVPLAEDGDAAMISDGAGTGMLTLDLLSDAGVNLASFCELGGMTSKDVMYRAMQLTLENHDNIKGVIIVLIGGFNRMDNMALGITEYVKEHDVKIPIYTRMCGTMEEVGIETMRGANMPTYYILTDTVKEFAEQVREV